MIKKITLIDVIQKEILFNGDVQIEPLKNEGTLYIFGNQERMYTWKVWKNGMIIKSEADYILELTLRLNNTTKGHIETEFGTIDLKCRTTLYKINENCIEVQYMLNEDINQLFHFILEMDKEENYAIH